MPRTLTVRYGIIGGLIGGTLSLAIHLAIRFWPITLALIAWISWVDRAHHGPERRAELAKFDETQVVMSVDHISSEPWFKDSMARTITLAITNNSIARVAQPRAICRYRTSEIVGIRKVWTDRKQEISIMPGESRRVKFEFPNLIRNISDVSCTASVFVDQDDLLQRVGRSDLRY